MRERLHHLGARGAPSTTPRRRSGSQTLSNDRRPGHQRRLLEDEADLALAAGRRRRSSAVGQSTVPEVGSPRPAMMRSAVDLPQPEGPSRLTNSPSADVERHVAGARACRSRRSSRSPAARPAAGRGRAVVAGARPVAVGSGDRRRHAGLQSLSRDPSRAGGAVDAGPPKSPAGAYFFELHADALADDTRWCRPSRGRGRP